MKKTLQILTITCLITLSINSFAKSQEGIYMSASDFMNKKLSYEKDSKIHLNNSVWDMPYITIIDHGNKLKLEKDQIYGYVDRDNKVYRFYKNQEYSIVESGKIIIYSQIEHIAQSKGYEVKNNYYFSTSPGGEIIQLNLDNLKNAYRNNDKFIDLLDSYFSNTDVTVYDKIHSTYKVNYLYSKALK